MANEQQFCTFHVDQLFFGVEVEKVQEVLRFHEMTDVPLSPPVVRGLINLRGQIVTALDLRRLLDRPPLEGDELPMNVVVRGEDGVVSFLVDEIGDVLEVGEELFEPPPETLGGVARDLVPGVYKLDGRLLLTFDVEEAARLAAEELEASV